jgi:hypothetical protein
VEVALALFARSFRDSAGDVDLPLERAPPERQRGARIGGELAAFLAFVVGEKREAAHVAHFQQHRARPRLAVASDRRERHRVWLHELLLRGLREPAVELHDRVGIELATAQSAPRVVLSEGGKLGG